MSLVLKAEQVRRPSPRQPVLASQWDSVESDTESTAHERAHQQQQRMHTGHHEQKKCTLPQHENADRLQQVDDSACNDDEAEHHQVYDSLDAKPTLLQTEYLDTQMDERERTSQLPSGDAHSDLRYDPNWRTNLRGAGRFNRNPHVCVEDYYQVPKEKPGQSRGDSQGPVIKGGYRYIVNTSPAVAVTADTAGNEPGQPYHLHPQDDQTGAVTSPHSHNHALPEEDHSKPSCSVTTNEGDNSLPMGLREECVRSCDIHNVKTLFLQELGGTHEGPTQIQQMSTCPIVLVNKMSEDIVERNKTTLGHKTSQCGSYASVYGRKQEVPHNSNKVHATPTETGSQKDSSDPELKTHQLRISERKKAQRKEYHNPPRPRQQPPALEVKAEWGDCLSSTLAGPAAVAQPNPQKTTPSEPLGPTIHVNINLNTSSHLLPLIQQRGQDDIINLASLHGCRHWRPASEDELALSPGCQQTNPGVTSQMSWKGVNAHLHHRGLEGCPEQRQRTTALKWPMLCEGDGQDCPHEVHAREFPQSLPRTPSTTLSLGSGSYPVLPAIEKSTTGTEPELSPGVNTSSSNGYLGQMENQKQLRARVTYKAYSLKSYKQLKSDINLRGLGPDYSATEETKLKRQKLYSNVIREQNKKTSRIPFLRAKDPEGGDKKVPRVKALEYAKTIAKPPVQAQPQQRQKHWAQGFTEHASYLDVSQLATLDVLRKRHEEEKQAVALFRKVPAV